MLKAASLVYAIFMAFIIAVVCSAFIISAFHNELYISETIANNQLRSDSKSGIQLLLSDQTVLLPDESRQVDLFDDDIHPVDLKRMSWGVYEVIYSSARWRKQVSTKIAMTGTRIKTSEQIALYMADKNKPLALCGKTNIRGNCYLPRAGVKRAYIEGQNFVGKNLINGQSFNSQSQLPKINEVLLNASQYYMGHFSKPADSIVHFNELAAGDSVINSFANKTLLLYDNGPVRISGLYLKGNIIIRSERMVTFASGSQTEDILVYAPNIILESGFTGNIQLYASDTILVAEKCTLNYPSSLALVNPRKREKNMEIKIHENSVVEGSVFVYNPYQVRKSVAYLTVDKDALIRGQVYCNDHVQLKGKVHGSLYVNAFLLKTPSSVYENHLLNAEIDRLELSDHFAGIPLIDDNNYSKEIVKWLN